MGQGFPPPPPPPPLATSSQPPNQRMNYGRQPAPLSIPPQPVASEGQTLTSATYVPVGDSFGHGVGIPPLLDSHSRIAYDGYGNAAGNGRRVPHNPPYDSDGTPYKRDGGAPPTPPARNIPSSFTLHDNVHELVSSGVAATANQNPQQQNVGPVADLTKSPSQRYNDNNMSLGGMSPSEATVRWPLERVLLWLAKNGFSMNWQETFKALELQGADFLELGHGSNGRGNLGKMHKVVYPQLANECEKSGTGWDQTRERDEGKRMRKLIRQIHEDGSRDSGVPFQKRDSHPSLAISASEGAAAPDASPKPGSDTAPKSASSEYSPGLKAPQPGYNKRSSPQMRSVTLPAPGPHDSGPVEPGANDPTLWSRSDYPRSTPLGIRGNHKRQSPSTSSENGLFAVPLARSFEGSPQSGSPAMQHASLAHSGPSGDPGVKYEHTRGNSADSISGLGRGSIPTRYYDTRRQGQDARPSPHDSHTRQWGGEYPSPYPREQGKGFLNIFKKRPKPGDSSHPSPEDQFLESPTSPVNARQNGPYLPYTKSSYNSSDMSLGERPSSSSTSEQERLALRAKPAQKGKRWMFATADGWNYRLVDVTDLDSVETLRAAICQSLGISDWPGAQIFLTEPGQTDHEEPLNDTMLALSRRTKSDSFGSLKLFVRGTHPHLIPNNSSGLGVSFPEKVAPSPTTGQHQVHRKPLDEDALNRISPHNPVRPSSPHRQQALGASTLKPVSRDTSQPSFSASPADGTLDSGQLLDPERADLLARHEEHLREVERKQRAYRVSKASPGQPPRKDAAYGETGYRREGIIDFDTPRVSPYEDKKSDTLVPLRKPPSAPHESNTLSKVNSLSKRNVDRPHIPPPVQTHGLGAALASVGRITSAIGTPSPSVPVPGEHDHVDANSAAQKMPGKFATASYSTLPLKDKKLKQAYLISNQYLDATTSASQSATEKDNQSTTSPFPEQSPAKAMPGESPKRSLQTRKSYGPEFDFEEIEVSFERSPNYQDDSDDVSDDGLFAKPLANKSNAQDEGTITQRSETKNREAKPALSVNTEGRSRKGLSVSFKSPGSTGGDDAKRSSGIPESPEDDRPPPRRDSFARGDIWASRPPVEGVINNLDDFFPNIDLDTPYLEGQEDKQDPVPYNTQSGQNTSGTMMPEESTIRPSGAGIVAQRSMNRSGGLTRMKSIREVAKGANQTSRNKSVTSTGNQRSGDILRRKSTKMFGAKIMQISPKPGSRLSQLDPIPQQRQPQGNIPQRQPTFRIVRGQLIGKGTYGRVYLGINADNGEVLAVKQVDINPRVAGQDRDRIKEMVGAIDQEIDTMQHLEHPNIVQYLGCERGEYSIAIYLEYISGGSIGSCLRKHGKFEECVVKSLTRQTLAGLAYLHDQGILHRDLKADNILLDLDGSCKISDFGISKKTDNIYGNDSSNSMQGSVFWMAPEVIQSQGQGYSAKVDIWSLGCVVLEMFAGRRPWSREEAIGAIFKLGSLNQAPPIPEDVSMNISPAALAFMYDCFTV